MPRRALLAFMLGAIGALAAPAVAQVVRDANCDGTVDAADRQTLVAGQFVEGGPPCPNADINRDGRFSAADLMAFAVGPRITHLGIASPDGRPATPLGRLEDGTIVYFSNARFGFLFVVEAAPPPNGSAIGTTTFDSAPQDPARRPDFQILVEHTLGEGSRAVCDEFGVPAVEPPDFNGSQTVADSINDLACRFEVATTRNRTCTQDQFGQLGFVAPESRAQFCWAVNSLLAFPLGETRLSVQIRDRSGLMGPLQHLMLQTGNGPPPGTFTPRPDTPTPTVTETASPTPSASRTRTITPTRTQGAATPTAPIGSSPTLTRTRTRTPTAGGNTPTVTRTVTRTPTGPTATRTRTRTITPTVSGASPTRTRTATVSGPTATRTRTPTPTVSPTMAASGPVITFLGLTRADDVLLPPTGTSGDIPVYTPLFGHGFSIVVEAKPGASRAAVGLSTFEPGEAPDLQIQVTRALGDGSTLVCDDMPPILGGVPATNPPNLGSDPALEDRLNDLACRFVDGSGMRIGRRCTDLSACVLQTDGEFGCASGDATVQYCGFMNQALAFPQGETLVTVRVRDAQNRLGPARQILIRVQ